MESLKMLGLAAVAPLMAITGVASASAYTLCELGVNKERKCLTGPNGHSGTNRPVLCFPLTPFVKCRLHDEGASTEYIACSTSLLNLESMGTGSDDDNPMPAGITLLGWSGCAIQRGSPTCEVSKSSGYTASVSGGNGSMSVKGTGIKTKVVCGLIMSCEYEFTASGISMSLTGGKPRRDDCDRTAADAGRRRVWLRHRSKMGCDLSSHRYQYGPLSRHTRCRSRVRRNSAESSEQG